MKLTNIILKLVLIFSMTIHQACEQKNKLTIYQGDKFTIEYPSLWQTTNENGILNFFPKENYGAVTVSSHSNIDFPLDKTKEFILEMNEINDNPENVRMTMKGDVAEFYYEHSNKNLKWITKAIRKKNNFYLLTINCELDKWDKNKESFIAVMNSFRFD